MDSFTIIETGDSEFANSFGGEGASNAFPLISWKEVHNMLFYFLFLLHFIVRPVE